MNYYENLNKIDNYGKTPIDISQFGCLSYRLIRGFHCILCLKHYTISEFYQSVMFFNILDLVNKFNIDNDKSQTHIVSKLVNNGTNIQTIEYLIPNNDFIITIDKKYKFYLRYEVNRLQIYTKHIGPFYRYFNLEQEII